jgi:hypothetical protein
VRTNFSSPSSISRVSPSSPSLAIMVPRRQPLRGGARANEARDAPRAREATGAGGTGASGAAAGGVAARMTTTSHPVPGKSHCFSFALISFEISLGFFFALCISEVLRPS